MGERESVSMCWIARLAAPLQAGRGFGRGSLARGWAATSPRWSGCVYDMTSVRWIQVVRSTTQRSVAVGHELRSLLRARTEDRHE